MLQTKTILLTVLRLAQGFIFLWAFFDKLLGLNFATKPAQAWINGGSPTAGFLTHAPNVLIQNLGGQLWVDWVFMIGLLCLGIALIFAIGLRIAAFTGALMMLLMWFSLLPLANNPLIDDHIIYALLFLLWPQLTIAPRWWRNSALVKQAPCLR